MLSVIPDTQRPYNINYYDYYNPLIIYSFPTLNSLVVLTMGSLFHLGLKHSLGSR